MDNNVLYVLNICALIILCILAIINNIRMNSLSKSWDYDAIKFKRLKNAVNIFNYSRFIYLPVLYFLFKYTDSKLYSMLGMLIVLWIQIIVQVAVYNLMTESKIKK